MEQQKKVEKDTKDKNVSRRDFIKVAGVAAVGVGMGGCTSGPKKTSKNIEQNTLGSKVSKRQYKIKDGYDVVVYTPQSDFHAYS